ncbi:hypothetical protein AAG906_031116 [Vitis piasezkii]|uniref:DUF620 domain-containing protein n=2 Tax=Vitis vinifera TaxID=29760 RepID=A0ABY9DTP1_VITVI|nr:uncharacterized protein LOC100257372 [Vitis vinifera]WKA10124.1 hypothetical protein VitviT2T_027716 [Vitis vinifera]|eukprot:XP_002281510.1 PREDICTED: uncharacterized protein LOC100257372 [Vitis vinifera]
MRKLCPNFDKENGLETVLEVPIPEEMFKSMGSNVALRWQNMRAFMKGQCIDKASRLSDGCGPEFRLLLKLVGSPLIPVQVPLEYGATFPIKDCSIEASTAKYIVQQYIAATGGWAALNAVHSMYAVGQVRMISSDMSEGEERVDPKGNGEVGGFVLWQKNPDLWYLELVVSGCKVSAGSDGKVAWGQTSSQASHANRGPPRPLRRFFQGLDPRFTANLFLDAVCIGEKTINNEDCFILKMETSASVLKGQSTPKTEIVHHTVWGYFSMRTGLLIQFEDTKLVRMKAVKGEESVFWETSLESVIEDYRYVDGINIAHGGKTTATLYRYGEASNHKRRIEETWGIEEIDFNICGLTMESFLPPADLKIYQDGGK